MRNNASGSPLIFRKLLFSILKQCYNKIAKFVLFYHRTDQEVDRIGEKKREFLFDNIRGILILLVVLGHALEYFRLENELGKFIYVFIYLFHMPVFIFISGYFSKNLEKARSNAVRTFLIPYLLLNLILSIILLALGKIQEIMILNPGWTLWYLYCMFIWRLLLPDLVKVRHILVLSFIVGTFSGLLTEFGTYMAMARTLGFLPYFLAGYFTTQERIEKIRQWPLRKTVSGLIIACGLGAAAFWLRYDLPPELLWGDRAYALNPLPWYKNVGSDIFLYVLGFAFVFVFIVLAEPRPHFFSFWGQKTLSIYLLHIYLIAPLVQFTQAIKNPYLHLAVLIGGSMLVVYLLSRKKVTETIDRVLQKIIHFIMPY